MTTTLQPRDHTATENSARISNRVTIALIKYLESVAEALGGVGLPVAGVDTTSTAAAGGIAGRIQLGRQHPRSASVPGDVAELHWHEHTGWQFALRRRGEPDAVPWRFLHFELAPIPAHVAAFARGLLHGQDLGLPYPAQFRIAGHDQRALSTLLSRRAVSTNRAGLLGPSVAVSKQARRRAR